ncbi:MAG: ATP-dependent DNA helicase RecQ [Myxococcota bacterium]
MSVDVTTPLPPTPDEVLRGVFGFSAFRPLQRAAVDHCCAGRDVVVLMPTGGGKSLCFQVPAVVAARAGRGPTVVISPLISLMKDQVDALLGKGVRAAMLNSSMDELEQMRVEANFLTQRLDLLYLSPERLAAPSFQRMLQKTPVALAVVDEAHCVSQWGHDFRPEYLTIANGLHAVRERGAPMMALTASATHDVVTDLVQRLRLRAPTVLRGGFERPNLSFQVLHRSKDAERLEHALTVLERWGLRGAHSPHRAILYAATRQKVEDAAEHLSSRGVAVGAYHAGLSDAARERAQRDFALGRRPVLVATNAFGMGVDQPNVRAVIHLQAPGSLEAYYQEAGRAGRDGEPAECLLFYGPGDVRTQQALHRKGKVTRNQLDHKDASLQVLVDYAHAQDCRQVFMVRHFAGADAFTSPCGRCDVCTRPHDVRAMLEEGEARKRAKASPANVTPLPDQELAVVLGAAHALRKPVGKLTLAKALRGSNAADVRRKGLLKLPQHGALAHHSEDSLVVAIERLLASGKLVRKGVKYPTVWPANKAVRGAREDSPDADTTPRRRRGRGVSPLHATLLRWRQQTARRLKWKPYMVMPNATLQAIADEKPQSLETLLCIRGLGPARVERFGEELLRLTRGH